MWIAGAENVERRRDPVPKQGRSGGYHDSPHLEIVAPEPNAAAVFSTSQLMTRSDHLSAVSASSSGHT